MLYKSKQLHCPAKLHLKVNPMKVLRNWRHTCGASVSEKHGSCISPRSFSGSTHFTIQQGKNIPPTHYPWEGPLTPFFYQEMKEKNLSSLEKLLL